MQMVVENVFEIILEPFGLNPKAGLLKFGIDMFCEYSGFVLLQMALYTIPVGRLGLVPTVRSFGVLG